MTNDGSTEYGYDEDEDYYDLEPILVAVGDVNSLWLGEFAEELWKKVHKLSESSRTPEADEELLALRAEFTELRDRVASLLSQLDQAGYDFDDVVSNLGPGQAET